MRTLHMNCSLIYFYGCGVGYLWDENFLQCLISCISPLTWLPVALPLDIVKALGRDGLLQERGRPILQTPLWDSEHILTFSCSLERWAATWERETNVANTLARFRACLKILLIFFRIYCGCEAGGTSCTWKYTMHNWFAFSHGNLFF